jgi:hypothetical protein
MATSQMVQTSDKLNWSFDKAALQQVGGVDTPVLLETLRGFLMIPASQFAHEFYNARIKYRDERNVPVYKLYELVRCVECMLRAGRMNMNVYKKIKAMIYVVLLERPDASNSFTEGDNGLFLFASEARYENDFFFDPKLEGLLIGWVNAHFKNNLVSDTVKERYSFYTGDSKKRASSENANLSRAKKFNSGSFIPQTRNTLERLLMRLRLTSRIFSIFIDFNLPFPASFLLFRVISVCSGGTLFYKKGNSTAFLCIKDCNISYASNIHDSEVEIVIQFKATLLVHEPKHVQFIPDTTPVSYINGGGTRFFDYNRHTGAYKSKMSVPDIQCCIVGRNYKCSTDFIPRCGRMQPNIYSTPADKKNALVYETAQIYRSILDFPDENELVEGEDMFSQKFYGSASKHIVPNYWRAGFWQCETVTASTGECTWQKREGWDGMGSLHSISDFDTISNINDPMGSGLESSVRRIV